MMENPTWKVLITGLLALVCLVSAPALSAGEAESRQGDDLLLTPREKYVLYMETENYKTLESHLQKTSIYKLIHDDEMKDFVADLTVKFKAKTKRIEDLMAYAREIGAKTATDTAFTLQMIGQKVEEKFKDITNERSRFYLFLPDLPSEGVFEEPERAIPGVLGIFEFPVEQLKEAKEAYRETLTLLDEEENLEVSVTETKKTFMESEVPCFEVKVEASESITLMIKLFWWGNYLYAAMGVGEKADELFALLQTGEDPYIETLRARVEGEKPAGFISLKVKPLLSLMEDVSNGAEKDTFNKVLHGFGLDSLESVQYGLAFDGENFRETVFLGFPEGPKGMFNLLVSKRSPSPLFVPLRKDSALMMEGALDSTALGKFAKETTDLMSEITKRKLEEFRETMEGEAVQEIEESDKVKEVKEKTLAALACLDGRFAVSLYEPGLGSLLPRLALCAGLTDKEKASALIAEARKEATGLFFNDQKFKEIPFTTITIENNAFFSPAYTFFEDELILAESPITIKEFIKDYLAQERGEKAPAPAGKEGENLPFWKIDYHVGEIFQLFYDRYFPLLNMNILTGLQKQSDFTGIKMDGFLIDPSLLPLSETFVEYLHQGRGGLYLTKDGIVLRSASSLGNPIVAVLGPVLAFGAGISMGFGMDANRGNLEKEIVREQLEIIRAALNTYRSAFGGGTAYPQSLGDLVEKGLIENPKIFLVPSDKAPDSIEFENMEGEIVTLAVSFVYMPEKKLFFDESRISPFEGFSPEIRERIMSEEARIAGTKGKKEPKAVLLYEARDNFHPGRMVLFHSGEIREYSEKDFKKLISLRR